jgi:hypothetical protein
MWSKIVLLALVAVAVTAEEITIEDYQGPEEQVSTILNRTINLVIGRLRISTRLILLTYFRKL